MPTTQGPMGYRVDAHAEPGSLCLFAVTRQPGMPDEAWESGKRGLDEEFAVLKELLAQETAGAPPVGVVTPDWRAARRPTGPSRTLTMTARPRARRPSVRCCPAQFWGDGAHGVYARACS